MAAYGTDEGLAAWLASQGLVLPAGSNAAVLRQIGSAYIDAAYEWRLQCSRRAGGFEQELAWPRSGHRVNGQAVPDTLIPPAWLNASYRAAYLEAMTPGWATSGTNPNRVTKREKVDVIEREFFGPNDGFKGDAAAGMPVDSVINGMILPLALLGRQTPGQSFYGDLMETEPLGVMLHDGPANGALPVFRSDDGAGVAVQAGPYLGSDGKSLMAPVPVYEVEGNLGADSLGRPVDALPVSGLPIPPDPEPVWQPFTVTVADTGEWIGYTSGDIASPPFNPPVGTVSNQPNSRHALEALYVDMGDGAVVAIFHGDMTGAAQGLGIQIDDYQGEASDVSMFAGNTVIRFAPPRNPLNDGETYGVVFTPMEA